MSAHPTPDLTPIKEHQQMSDIDQTHTEPTIADLAARLTAVEQWIARFDGAVDQLLRDI